MTDTIKKGALALAAVTALGFGGAQIANATNGNQASSPTAAKANGPTETPDAKDATETADAKEPADVVAPADAARAGAAALVRVPGKVTGVSAENAADDASSDAPDTPEPGDKADPEYESKIAFTVEVTKADGTTVDVHLDNAFAVLGTETEGPESAGDDHGSDTGGRAGEQGGTETDG